MGVVGPRLSYADLASFPDDGRRYEIYDGEVFVVPAPIPLHQIVALNLHDLFKTWTRRHGGIVLASPIDIVLSPYDVVQPDVVFFQPSRQSLVRLREAIREPPDIAIEVLSPSTAGTDRGRKMRLLARYGVAEYWLVDPDAERVEIYDNGPTGYALVGEVGRGGYARSVRIATLECPVDEIFRTPFDDPAPGTP